MNFTGVDTYFITALPGKTLFSLLTRYCLKQTKLKYVIDPIESLNIDPAFVCLRKNKDLAYAINCCPIEKHFINPLLSVILVDIDFFKKINDTYGHKAGDEVLRAIGKILLFETRASDIAVRYGGEELALILPNTTSEGAEIVAKRIHKKIEDTVVFYKDKSIKCTASLGVASAFSVDEAIAWAVSAPNVRDTCLDCAFVTFCFQRTIFGGFAKPPIF